MIEVINKACGLDIHKLFFIATILSISGEKQQQRFDRDDEGILALINWLISEKCNVVACESTSDFWVPIHDSLIRYLPVDSEVISQLALNNMIQPSRVFQMIREILDHMFDFGQHLYKKEQI